ncbi:MAG: hypothetical protein QOG43_1956, partial [Actinomycetota bacterium]|nr:hypothetical protein [Actinomycetota bacterium]
GACSDDGTGENSHPATERPGRYRKKLPILPRPNRGLDHMARQGRRGKYWL